MTTMTKNEFKGWIDGKVHPWDRIQAVYPTYDECVEACIVHVNKYPERVREGFVFTPLAVEGGGYQVGAKWAPEIDQTAHEDFVPFD
jgi:hypothetical protein